MSISSASASLAPSSRPNLENKPTIITAIIFIGLLVGGLLYTASCSFHLTKPLFVEMLQDAAADSGRRIAIRALTGQPLDHPEVLTIPETGYIKGALLEVMD